jgi:hypothetical protein
VAWEPPYEYRASRVIVDVLFEMNAKLADIRDHLAFVRRLLEDEDDGEEEEEAD